MDRVLPRNCSVFILQKHFPLIHRPAPVLLGLDNQRANRLMGTFEYRSWIKEQLDRLIRNESLPRQTQHIVLQPFMKSLRPENPIHENLEQIHVFHGLTYPSGWRGSFRDYARTISLRVLGNQQADARTGDLPSEWIERLCLELFRSQQFLVYSFHSKTMSYLPSLMPALWVAPVSILNVGIDRSAMPILIDRESLILQEIVYPSPHTQESRTALIDLGEEDMDDEDEGEDGQEVDSRIENDSTAWRSTPGSTRKTSRFHHLLQRCPAINPDTIEDGGQQATFCHQRLEQAIGRGSLSEFSSLLVVFLSESCENSREGLLCDAWSIGSDGHFLALRLDATDIESMESSKPGSSGCGELCLCAISGDAEPAELYAWVRKDAKHLPVEMLEPLLRLARIDGFRLRPRPPLLP